MLERDATGEVVLWGVMTCNGGCEGMMRSLSWCALGMEAGQPKSLAGLVHDSPPARRARERPVKQGTIAFGVASWARP